MSRTRNTSRRGITGRFVMALVALGIVLSVPTVASAAPFKLYVDPGHGGRDPGAVSRNFTEKASNLRISRLVAQVARRQGWSVKMSRNGDYFVPLNTRANRANAWRANAFVSIHANSTGRKSLGYMTIYRGKRSARMGRNIMLQTARLTPYKDIGNKSDVRGLAVLRGTRMPAVLVETLAVSSPRERAQLKNPRVQRNIAEAVVRGIARDRGMAFVPAGGTAKPKAVKKRATVTPPAAQAPSNTTTQSVTTTTQPTLVPVEPTTRPTTETAETRKPVTEKPVKPVKKAAVSKVDNAPVTTAEQTAPESPKPVETRTGATFVDEMESVLQPVWFDTILKILTL